MIPDSITKNTKGSVDVEQSRRILFVFFVFFVRFVSFVMIDGPEEVICVCPARHAGLAGAKQLLVMERMAHRLSKLAEQHGCTYTQYVDNITFSGAEHTRRLRPTITKILKSQGFVPHEIEVETTHEEQLVTGVRVNNRQDVPSKKIKEIRERITAWKATGCPYSELPSIEGQIAFVTRLNKGAGTFLRRQLRGVRPDL